MRIKGLWRYPVKSMQGEALNHLDVGDFGVAGDRHYGVLDLASGTIVSAKRDGRLLQARSLLAGPEVVIKLPNGETVFGTGPGTDKALSDWLEKPVRLLEAQPGGRATFESQADYEDDASVSETWQGPPGSFVDSSGMHLVTTSTLRALGGERPDLAWVIARFRPNVLLETEEEGCVELGWGERTLRLGSAELAVRKPCSRCVMTTRPQPGGIERQLDILRHVTSHYETNLGILLRSVKPGRVEIGDEVTLV